MKKLLKLVLLLPLLYSATQARGMNFHSKKALGKALYSDKSLSKNRKMSCATCHHKKRAFIDIRKSSIGHMAGFSADKQFIGDRNVPTASYSAQIPPFHSVIKDGEKVYIGGQFLDGRAKDLKEQAKGPFLNPIEMQMPSKEAVIERVKENRRYRKAFKRIYGRDIFSDIDASYDALADAIASFEKSRVFSPFNSRYDKFLKGRKRLSKQELRGLALFSDTTRANCVACHPISGNRPLLTNFKYNNLGVPINDELRALNGKGETFIDHGLLDNPNVDDVKFDGAFRVSTLRNIAETAPYMHNGIFKELKTVVHFYNTRDVEGAINPETGQPWRDAEVPATVNHTHMGDLGLSDAEEDDIVAFLKTLTDKRYQNRRAYTHNPADIFNNFFKFITTNHMSYKFNGFVCNTTPRD